MTMNATIALCQINTTVAAIEANSELIISTAIQARDQHHASIAVFPELALSGYPPEDLLFRTAFYQRIEAALEHILQQVQGITCVIGYPYQDRNGRCYNRAAVIRDGSILTQYDKQCLPNYAVFDEARYFTAGQTPCVFTQNGVQYGVLICEDLWHPEPMAATKAAGAQMVLTLNASPYTYDKHAQRLEIVKQRVQEQQLPLAYVNLVGGQDELVFDGASFFINEKAEVTHQAVAFEATTLTNQKTQLTLPPPNTIAEIYQALKLGIHDYVNKNGFKSVVLGLSGGIDSAVTAALACDALGAEKVHTVMMPSPYTSAISLEDAKAEAVALGCQYTTLPINDINTQFLNVLEDAFQGKQPDVTEENLQARIRCTLLMALSNKFGSLVLTTSNKSEMAVGYSTLYGDMAGGFAVLKDVLKTRVYELATYRNSLSPVIPERVLTRAPSAELAPDQTDQDSLPPYDILDQIVTRYIELDQDKAVIVAAGFNASVVDKIIRLIKRNEYKRRQGAPGPRITSRAFGKDWRYPITASGE